MPKFSSDFRRKAIVGLLQFEGLVILALGIFLIVKGLTSGGTIEWFVISGILGLALIGGIGLLFAARGYKLKRMYGRAPAVLANLIALGVSKYMYEGGLWWLSLPLALYSAVIIILALSLTPDSD